MPTFTKVRASNATHSGRNGTTGVFLWIWIPMKNFVNLLTINFGRTRLKRSGLLILKVKTVWIWIPTTNKARMRHAMKYGVNGTHSVTSTFLRSV